MSNLMFSAPIVSFKDEYDWLAQVQGRDLKSVYLPIDSRSDERTITAYESLIVDNKLCVAEVGVWNNLLDIDPTKKSENIEYCIAQLKLADRFKARCCVNIAGTTSALWDGPATNYRSVQVENEIVRTIQYIIDAAQPKHTYYSLESMPHMLPDSPENYLKLIDRVDRPNFGVHIDLANWINQPSRFYTQHEFMDNVIEFLGPFIKSVHLKDITIGTAFPFSAQECRPGTGQLDLTYWLSLLDKVVMQQGSKQLPVMLEHLDLQVEYDAALAHVRGLEYS
jgi:sugar phosphate isomerase/epimerase